ncbi:GNAT family N-acetyltransferase [Tahibacter amnicola]|uniref:GNAT family N-acetyltransferase n=1 Tax=Tahibacter amnicola TaxID=2976241 RepID=A0ABY6BJY0_9GAMM|nr:GNAT family N-acetyltransferase [Tahibacter amnicola]UXI70067.1 GNAT family N-acetyltransferase [Tahibacter amnicola]
MTSLVLHTERLTLRHLDESDADFIFELVTDPAWLRYIGDKGVRNRDDACAYIRNGPMAMIAAKGFGLYCVTSRDTGEALGICGLIKRDTLADVDLGFAFLPRYRAMGFAREAAAATLVHAREDIGLRRLVAIVSPQNSASASLLCKIGFSFETRTRLSAGDHDVDLYGITL